MPSSITNTGRTCTLEYQVSFWQRSDSKPTVLINTEVVWQDFRMQFKDPPHHQDLFVAGRIAQTQQQHPSLEFGLVNGQLAKILVHCDDQALLARGPCKNPNVSHVRI